MTNTGSGGITYSTFFVFLSLPLEAQDTSYFAESASILILSISSILFTPCYFMPLFYQKSFKYANICSIVTD